MQIFFSAYLPTYLPSYYHRHDNSLSLLLRRFLPSYTLLFLNTPLSFSFTNICTNFIYLSHFLTLYLSSSNAKTQTSPSHSLIRKISLSLTISLHISVNSTFPLYIWLSLSLFISFSLSLSLNNPVSHVFVSSVFQRSSSSFSCLKKD